MVSALASRFLSNKHPVVMVRVVIVPPHRTSSEHPPCIVTVGHVRPSSTSVAAAPLLMSRVAGAAASSADPPSTVSVDAAVQVTSGPTPRVPDPTVELLRLDFSPTPVATPSDTPPSKVNVLLVCWPRNLTPYRSSELPAAKMSRVTFCDPTSYRSRGGPDPAPSPSVITRPPAGTLPWGPENLKYVARHSSYPPGLSSGRPTAPVMDW